MFDRVLHKPETDQTDTKNIEEQQQNKQINQDLDIQ